MQPTGPQPSPDAGPSAACLRNNLSRKIISRYELVRRGRSGPLESALPARLDTIDRQILKELQDDGRMTNVELASRVGISAPPCLRRVRALERAGIIKGYHAELSPEALGYSVSVFALVGLNSQAEADLKSFEELIAKWDEVRECHMLAGEADFLRHPEDPRDAAVFRPAVPVDEFVLKYQKPL